MPRARAVRKPASSSGSRGGLSDDSIIERTRNINKPRRQRHKDKNDSTLTSPRSGQPLLRVALHGRLSPASVLGVGGIVPLSAAPVLCHPRAQICIFGGHGTSISTPKTNQNRRPWLESAPHPSPERRRAHRASAPENINCRYTNLPFWLYRTS